MTLQSELVFEARVTVAPPLELGDTPRGRRRVIHITGGSVAGPQLNGTVIPGGADWQVIRRDGVTELTALYEIKTDDGALIHVTNRGLRHGPDAVMQRLVRGEAVDPAAYYFRTVPSFEAPLGRYEWLNRAVFVGSGARFASEVRLQVFRIL